MNSNIQSFDARMAKKYGINIAVMLYSLFNLVNYHAKNTNRLFENRKSRKFERTLNELENFKL